MIKDLKQAFGVWCIRKIQKYGPHKVKVNGRSYEISEEVFNPKYYYTSKFMAFHIDVKPKDEVLDMGTGSGILAITAAQNAKRVIAVDINPEAVRHAKRNIRINGMENKVQVLPGDLFSPLNEGERFDVIFFTPPYLKGSVKSNLDHALFDHDKALARRFFEEAKEHLKEDGYIQMVYSSIAEPENVLKISDEFGWRHEVIAMQKLTFETFMIYRLSLN